MLTTATQPSFDDLGTPLSEVTFVVLDLETTGASPADCEITEIGAVRYRSGELLGTFQTLVNPGTPIPPFITVLTGITEAMVLPAPRLAEVLPAFLEFLHGAVIVGHNVRFDVSFLDAALVRHGYPRLANRRVDTVGLARRLVQDEVPNLRLATLARHLRSSVEPCHRALADAQATVEVLHALLERAGTLGVLGLDDLLALPTIRSHPSAGKLRLTSRLPRTPGVYLFRDRNRRPIYVGKATNLRGRVRSYFSGDTRRKVPQLLREVEAIDWIECATPLEAAVREIRLIQAHEPRFNRVGKGWRGYVYLKLTLDERFPRLAVVREPRADDGLYVGPLRSTRAARGLQEAIESALPIRRCTQKIGRARPLPPGPPCTAFQLGVACCPCRGVTDERAYADVVQTVVRGLTSDERLLLDPLERRMHALAAAERFEEAALARDRAALVTGVLRRQRLVEWLARAPQLRLAVDGHRFEISHGRLVLSGEPPPEPLPAIVPRAAADELALLGRFVHKEVAAGRAVLEGAATPALPPERYRVEPRRGIRRVRAPAG